MRHQAKYGFGFSYFELQRIMQELAEGLKAANPSRKFPESWDKLLPNRNFVHNFTGRHLLSLQSTMELNSARSIVTREDLELWQTDTEGHDGVVQNGSNLEGSGVPVEWAQDVADPSIAGLADPSFNNRQAPEVKLSPDEVVSQTRSIPAGPGHDIANFVPGPGAQPDDAFPEPSHEEKLQLLHRYEQSLIGFLLLTISLFPDFLLGVARIQNCFQW